MRKSIIAPTDQDRVAPEGAWLDLDCFASVEVTSEDPGCPIEGALVRGRGPGWRAAGPGAQLVRLRFDAPRRVRRVWLHFAEPDASRTQEFVLRWGAADDQPVRDVVRQQWTFSPGGSTHETEDYRLDLWDVTVLELAVTPDVTGGAAHASLAELRVA